MGGIESFMCSLMLQQQNDGHQVLAIVHHHKKQQPFTEEFEGDLKVFRVPCSGQLAYAPISPSFSYRLDYVIKQEVPDVIHIHMPNLSAFWCLLLPLARKVPWVIHWHADVIGSVPDLKIKLLYPFYRVFELALLKRAKKIIATSPVYLASSQPLIGFRNKTAIIPLGLPSVKGVIKEEIKERENICLLMIGRLTYYKGHRVIVEAIAKLKAQGINCSLSIVGGGELFENIEQQIKLLDLDDNVTLLGKLSDVDLHNELLNTDLLCLPSIERTEAFGVVLLEAMRVSKPCLVSDVEGSGMSWVVRDNCTGFVVKHNNVSSLVDKLIYVNENRRLLTEYGESGRKRFEAMFSIKAVSDEVSALYDEVVIDSETSSE